MQPKVWIITINRNGLLDTRECLDSLLVNSYQNKEIILVDNNSNNNEWVQLQNEYWSKWVHCILNAKNRWFAWWCNDWIKSALWLWCEYILLFNNDAVANQWFLERIVQVASSKKSIWIVWPAITYYQSEILWYAWGNIWLWTWLFTHQFKNKHKNILTWLWPYHTDYITWCCMLIKKSVIEQLWLFDEDYFAYFEETDYCFRAQKLWRECLLVPDVSIEHKKSASTWNKWSNILSKTQAYLLARNWLLFWKKNLNFIQKYVYCICRIVIGWGIDSVFHIRSWYVLKNYWKGVKEWLA